MCPFIFIRQPSSTDTSENSALCQPLYVCTNIVKLSTKLFICAVSVNLKEFYDNEEIIIIITHIRIFMSQFKNNFWSL